MSMNEEETKYHLINPVLMKKGYDDPQRIRLETPAPVEPTGHKGQRRKGPGRVDYLLCVQVGDMPKPLPVGVIEAKRENADPLKGMGQAKDYAACKRFEVKYVFATNGHLYGEFDFITNLQGGPFPLADFPSHPDLTARYSKDAGIDVTQPEAAILFQADSPAWSKSRYYQDAAIRAAFEKIIHCKQNNEEARVLKQRGKAKGECRYSWTIDFTARRSKAREEMQPILDEAAEIKGEVVGLKQQFKQLKKEKAGRKAQAELSAKIKEKEKAARDLESKAADIDAAVFDLKAVNPNAVVKVDTRTPGQIIENIKVQSNIVSNALLNLEVLLK